MDGPLADDLYFVLHDPFTGRPRASAGRAEICLAAALISELLLDDHVRMLDGMLILVDRPEPTCPLAAAVLGRLERQLAVQQRGLADWLPDIAPSAPQLIGERLLRFDRGIQVRRRRLTLSADLIAAVEPSVHELAVDRLAAYLRNVMAPDIPELILAALVLLAAPRPDPVTGTPAAQEFVVSLVPDLPDAVRALLARAERVLGGDRISTQQRSARPQAAPERATGTDGARPRGGNSRRRAR